MYYESAHARRSFSYMDPRLWNNLPDIIRLSTNLIHFKKQTKYVLCAVIRFCWSVLFHVNHFCVCWDVGLRGGGQRSVKKPLY